MRAFEFIKEATLYNTSSSSWMGYLNNMLTVSEFSIGKTGEKKSGLKLTDGSREKIKGFIASLSKVPPSTDDAVDIGKSIEAAILDFTDEDNNVVQYKIKNIFKSPEIRAQGASGDEGSDEDEKDSGKGGTKKYWNDGEVAETFLGAALFARFKSQSAIDIGAVKSTIQDFKTIPGGFAATGVRGQDPIDMTALNKPVNNQVVTEYIQNYEELKSKFPKGVAGLDTLINACVRYVNESSKVLEALEKADGNPGKDKIVIKTDGVSDQKGTKADLTFSVGGEERLLSLKANAVKQFGQDTGATPEVIKTFFGRFIPDLAVPINADWPDVSRKGTKALKKSGANMQAIAKQIYGYIGEAYSAADAKINEKLQNPDSASNLVQDIYDGIRHHAQGSKEQQTLVILNPSSKKSWQELEFGPKLKDALTSFRLETKLFKAGMDGENNHILQIFGRAKDSVAAVAQTTTVDNPKDAQAAVKQLAKKKRPADPEMLLQLRSYIQEVGPTIRNIVEMGPLLKTLTEVQMIKDELKDKPPEPNAKPKTEPAKPDAGKDELNTLKKNAGIPAEPPAEPPAAQPTTAPAPAPAV